MQRDKEAPRPCHLVVLSDRGQTGGATFKQRYQMTLEDRCYPPPIDGNMPNSSPSARG